MNYRLSQTGITVYRRFIAAVTVCLFLLSDLLFFPSTGLAQAQDIQARSAVLSQHQLFPSNIEKVEVPEALGVVQDRFQGNGTNPVVLIQDAHAVPSAQKSIQQLIAYFQETYGVSLVAVEGASTRLDSQFFRSFPDKERLAEALTPYANAGHLTGVVEAALLNPTACDFQGIEDAGLYEEGVRLYREAFAASPAFALEIGKEVAKQNELRKKLYSSELLSVEETLDFFYANKKDLFETLKVLASIRKPVVGTSLSLLLEEMEKAKTPAKGIAIEKELGQLALRMNGVLKSRFSAQSPGMKAWNEKYQSFRTGSLNSGEYAVFLKGTAEEHKIPLTISLGLDQTVTRQKKFRDIEGGKLMEEFESYAGEIARELLKKSGNAAEVKRRYEQSKQLRLFKKLAQLELGWKDWEVLKTDAQSFVHSSELHRLFYQNAEKRDQAFFKNLMRMMRKKDHGSRTTGLGEANDKIVHRVPASVDRATSAAMLVAGGFHTQGIARRLKAAKVPYLVIQPAMGQIPEQSVYRAQMSGEVPWKDYFEVRGGRVNVADAFSRVMRDKLLNSVEAPGLRTENKQNSFPSWLRSHGLVLAKEWRDQIVRDLAVQGHIEKAGDYTHYLDEVAGRPIPKIERFINGLKKLENSRALTKDAILGLLKGSHILSAAAGNTVLGQATVPSAIVMPDERGTRHTDGGQAGNGKRPGDGELWAVNSGATPQGPGKGQARKGQPHRGLEKARRETVDAQRAKRNETLSVERSALSEPQGGARSEARDEIPPVDWERQDWFQKAKPLTKEIIGESIHNLRASWAQQKRGIPDDLQQEMQFQERRIERALVSGKVFYLQVDVWLRELKKAFFEMEGFGAFSPEDKVLVSRIMADLLESMALTNQGATELLSQFRSIIGQLKSFLHGRHRLDRSVFLDLIRRLVDVLLFDVQDGVLRHSVFWDRMAHFLDHGGYALYENNDAREALIREGMLTAVPNRFSHPVGGDGNALPQSLTSPEASRLRVLRMLGWVRLVLTSRNDDSFISQDVTRMGPEVEDILREASASVTDWENQRQVRAALVLARRRLKLWKNQGEARQARGEQEEKQGHGTRDTMGVDRGSTSGSNGELWAVTSGATPQGPGKGQARNGQPHRGLEKARRATKDETLSVERGALSEPQGGVRSEARQERMIHQAIKNYNMGVTDHAKMAENVDRLLAVARYTPRYIDGDEETDYVISAFGALKTLFGEAGFNQMTDPAELEMFWRIVEEVPGYGNRESYEVYHALEALLGGDGFGRMTDPEARMKMLEKFSEIASMVPRYATKDSDRAWKGFEALLRGNGFNRITDPKESMQLIEKFAAIVQGVYVDSNDDSPFGALLALLSGEGFNRVLDPEEWMAMMGKFEEIIKEVLKYAKRDTAPVFRAFQFFLHGEGFNQVADFAKQMKLLDQFNEITKELFLKDKSDRWKRVRAFESFFTRGGVDRILDYDELIVVLEMVRYLLKQFGEDLQDQLEDFSKALGEVFEDQTFREICRCFSQTLKASDDEVLKIAAAEEARRKIVQLAGQRAARKARGEQEEKQEHGTRDTGDVARGSANGSGELWTTMPSRETGNGERETRTFNVAREALPADKVRRSEARGVAQETAAVLLGAGAKDRELGAVAEKVQRTVTTMSVDSFSRILREEALRVLREITPDEILQRVRVNKDVAESVVKQLVERLKTSGLKGNLAIGFDMEAGQNFLEALSQLRSGIGVAVFSKEMAKAMPGDILKGLKTQTVTNFRSYKPFAAVNKVVPVLASDIASEALLSNVALFGVGVEAEGVEGEPFLEVVENVVRIAGGLLMAERLKSPKDLKDPVKMEEIRAELLKALFRLDVDSGVLSIQGRNLIVHRGLLQKFILEYKAQSAIRTAA